MKTFKSITAIILALVMTLAYVPFASAAEAPKSLFDNSDVYDFFIAYGGRGSASIKNGEVVLNKDITANTNMSFSIDSNKNQDIAINLNGHSIYFPSSGNTAIRWMSSNRSLTIKGSGTSYICGDGSAVLYSEAANSTVKIQGVRLTGTTKISTSAVISAYGSTSFDLNNCEIVTRYNECAVSLGQNSKARLNNVLFDLGNPSCKECVKMYGSNTVLEMNSCSFSSSYGDGVLLNMNADSARAKISGGNYNFKGTKASPLINLQKGELEINGGTFTSTNAYALNIVGGKAKISAGTFEGKPSAIKFSGANAKITDIAESGRCISDKSNTAKKIVIGNHNYKALHTVPATCVQTGSVSYECTVCKDEYTAVLPKTAHSPAVDAGIAPTFKNDGKTEGSHCRVCNIVLTPQVTLKKYASTSLKKVSRGKKSFTATWKKSNGVDGYQIQYSLKKNMKKSAKKTVKGYKKTKLTIKKLKKNKKYYVRIRVYKTVSGKKVYSKWSKVKTVKTR